MKSRVIVCTVAIAATLASTLATAQPRHDERDHRQDAREARQEGREARRDMHDRREERRDARDRRDDRREARERREEHAYYNARGPEFRRGHRLPPGLRERPYVVREWRAYRLAPPPRGYEWVQVGPDFVLVAIATGIIATVVIAN